MKPVTERLTDLRAAMAKAACDFFIMPSSDPHSSEYAPDHYTAWVYFSGFSCENSNLIVGKDEAAMWVDGRFFGAADKALKDTGVCCMHMGVKGVPTVHEWLAERLTSGKILGYCAETMPVSQMRQLKALCEDKGAKLVDLPLVDEAWTADRAPLPVTPAWLLDPKYSGVEPSKKMAIVRGKLLGKHCSAVLLTSLDSTAWMLNLRAADVDCTPYALAFCYLDMDKAVLFMDSSRLAPEAAAELQRIGVELAPYDGMPAFLAAGTTQQTVLVDPNTLNAALDNALRQNPCYTVVEDKDPVLMLKAVKNETELACTRHAHLNDAAAMCRFQMELERRLAAGEVLHETDVDDILHKFRSAVPGFLTESFGTISAYGPNAANMHYAPVKGQDAEIQRRGYLLVDSGATYLDGTTDITRTFNLGDLTEDEKLCYTRVLRCHIDVAMAVWKAGCTGGEIDMYARQPMWRHMLDYRCGTGHSVSHVGAVHEGPHSLRPHNAVPFVPGMIITDEPGIYEEGYVGIRIESEMECVEAGESEYGAFLRFEPITWVPIDLTCILPDELTKEEKEWINWYHEQTFQRVSPLLNEEETAWLRTKCAAI